eukprot:SM000020S06083  [mRNA]  locus=s20:973658:977052:- [translate_table: standard]
MKTEALCIYCTPEQKVSELVLAIQLVSAGLSLPLRFVETEWRSLLVLLGPVLIGTWAIAFAFAVACFHEHGVLRCLLIAACLTPTDPVLSSAILQGKFAERHLPASLRYLLQAESAANDGVALPYVYLPIVLLKRRYSTGAAMARWAYQVIGYQVVVAVVVGLVYGWVALFLFRTGVKRDLVDEPSFLAQVIGLALGSLGCVRVIGDRRCYRRYGTGGHNLGYFSSLGGLPLRAGSDGVLAVFCAAVGFASREPTAEENRYDAINGIELILVISYFMYFGTLLPWSAWNAIGYGRLIGFALSAAFLRRLPVMLACAPWLSTLRKDNASLSSVLLQAAFGGFQGPMGVAALFYAAVVQEELGDEFTFHVVSFVVLSSIIIHGLTSVPTTKLLASTLKKLNIVNTDCEAGTIYHGSQGETEMSDGAERDPSNFPTPQGQLDHNTRFVGGHP